MNILFSIFMVFAWANQFGICPEEVVRMPADPSGWGYYHLDMTESMCGLSIWSGGEEYLYQYDIPGDAGFDITWMGANMVWIDNPHGVSIESVSYWVGWNGRYSQLFLPQVSR